jgi:hypothetical protein
MIRPEKIAMIRELNAEPQQWGPKYGFPHAAPQH